MKHPELQLQITVADFLRQACPYPWTHIAHGGFQLDRRTASRLKACGLQPGWPDFMVLIPDGTLQLEIKTKTGRLSMHQRAHALWLKEKLPNHVYRVCRSLEDVQAALDGCDVPLRARAA